MTDSNLQFSDTDKKDSNLEFSETKDDANLEFGNQTQTNNLEFSSEKKELTTNQNETNFKTDFGSSLFNENLSLIDFNTEFDLSDTVNSLFLNQNDIFDFKEQDFSITRKIFEDLTVKDEGEKAASVSPAILNYLTMFDFLQGNQFSDMGFSNKPIERPNDLRNINKLMKKELGYSYNQFNNNLIPRDVLESDKFQKGLLNIRKFYENKNFTITDVKASDATELEKLAKGMGIEITGGIAADVALAPLLGFGPYGIGAYLISQFSIGYGLNINAQKERIGIENLAGNNSIISQAEALSAGFIQMVPFGVTAKGWKGVRRSAAFGGTLSVSETFLRDILGDEVTPEEYWLSLGLGTTFGGSFKGAVEGLDNIVTKYKGKTIKEIDSSLTNKEKKTINDSVEIIDEANEAINTKLENEGVSKTDLENEIKSQTTGEQVKPQTEGGEVRTYVMPSAYKNTKPNYGSAKIIFESDFDKMAYSLRLGKKAPDTQFKIDKERKILQTFLSQGFTEAEIRKHGAELHKKVKAFVTEKTGSATASPSNTKGLVIEIPADITYKDQVNTVLNKTPNKKLDLGDVNKNPQKASFIEKNPNLKEGQQEFLAANIRKKKDENTFPSITQRKSQQETKAKALDLLAGNKTPKDDNVISIANSKLLKERHQLKAKLYDEFPDDEQIYAEAQEIILHTENVAKINDKLMETYKTKNPKLIEAEINNLIEALDEVDDWLTMGLSTRTRVARAFKTMGMKPDVGLEGKKPAEIMDLTPAQKKKLQEESIDVSPVLNDLIQQNVDLKNNMIDAVRRANQTGDYSELIKQSQLIKDISGDVRNLVAVKSGNAINVWKIADGFGRVMNEIGINAVLSGPSTQKVNLFSGLAMTFMRSLNNFAGANNVTELKAAKEHLFALFYNLDFAAQTWKRSWDMEDNFVNVGNMKGQVSQRFMISSDNQGSFGRLADKAIEPIARKTGLIPLDAPYFPFNAIDFTGKTLRLPSRLMTANDALIQTPNIIGATAFYSFNEGMKKGLSGSELSRYVKSNIDGVIHYILKGQEGPIGRLVDPELGAGPQQFIPDLVTERILIKAKEFGKQITFTQDIRTEDLFGKGADFINNMAIKNPLVRFWLKFTRSPTNMFKEAGRYLPYVNSPMVVRFPDQLPEFGPKMMLPENPLDTFYQNRIAGKRQNLNFVNEFLLPEIRADLASPDPLVRQNTVGQIRMGYAYASLLMLAAHKNNEDPHVGGEPPHMFLTGGGPNYFNKNGAVEWISKYKNGWRPYSVATLKYDEDGDIVYRNGKPVYVYKSLEGIPDPMASLVRIFLDFAEMAPLSTKDKDIGEFIKVWVAFAGRNMFNKTYTAPLNELLNIIAAVPDLGENADPEEGVSYTKKKWFDYVGRQVGNSILPYSSLLKRIARTPEDILNIMGVTDELAKIKAIEEGDYSDLKWFLKPDTKTRAGDTANENVDYGDDEFNKVNAFIQIADNILNKIRESVGYNLGGTGVPQVEHITNEFVTYPQRAGFELFSTTPISESKNFRLYEATALIGRMMSPPPEVIRGSNFTGVGSKNFVPKKLDKKEYSKLQIYVNTVEINVGGPNKINIKEAMNRFFDSDIYQKAKKTIEDEGRDSDSGQLAAELIFNEMNKINTQFIKAGINLYRQKEMSETEFNDRINAKQKIKKKFFDKMNEDYKNFNLGS